MTNNLQLIPYHRHSRTNSSLPIWMMSVTTYSFQAIQNELCFRLQTQKSREMTFRASFRQFSAGFRSREKKIGFRHAQSMRWGAEMVGGAFSKYESGLGRNFSSVTQFARPSRYVVFTASVHLNRKDGEEYTIFRTRWRHASAIATATSRCDPRRWNEKNTLQWTTGAHGLRL